MPDDLLDKLAAAERSRSSTGGALPSLEDLERLARGKIAIVIHSDGSWTFQETAFHRPEMVALLSKSLVLIDQHYFLVAPEQLLEITVEDLPFVVTGVVRSADTLNITMSTNVQDSFVLGEDHPMRLRKLPGAEISIPSVIVRDGLEARLSRSCYYQMVEWGQQSTEDGRSLMHIYSAGTAHLLGYLD